MTNRSRRVQAGDWAHSGVGGAVTEVIAPPPGELLSETNDNSVAILLSYGTIHALLAGNTEVKKSTGERYLHKALSGYQSLKVQNKPS
jgi:beta-lactamase superfamily II metal-dependent hydrolase